MYKYLLFKIHYINFLILKYEEIIFENGCRINTSIYYS